MSINKINRVVIDESVKNDLDSKATKIELQNVKSELENKINTIVTNLDWKESVATFADLNTTYPNAEDGWTVNVKDEDITYRYDGIQWIPISSNSIPLATPNTDGKMSKTDKAKLDGIEAGAQVNPTAIETLALIKTVDGVGSGLEADTLRGKVPEDFATANHLHDGRYYQQSEVNTLLSGKSNVGHKHVSTDIADFTEAVQDAIGNAFENSSSINIAYDDINNTVKADIKVDNSTIEVDSNNQYIRVRDNGITDNKIGNRTISDTATPSSDSGSITTILSWLGNMIKSITGQASWRIKPTKTLEDLNAHMNSANPHSGHALKSTSISTSGGLAGGGDLSSNRNIYIVDGGVTDQKIGTRTVDDSTTTAYGNSGTLTQLLSWIVKSIKEVKGNVTNWYDGASSSINNLYSTLTSHIGSNGNSHSKATQSTDGFMSSSDKAKLDNIEPNANNYIHPSTHSADMIIDGTNNKAYTTEEKNKLAGISVGANKVTTSLINGNIKIDGIENNVYTHPSTHSLDVITETSDKKIMTASERSKLAGIEPNANHYIHPASHSLDMISETTIKKIMTSEERNKLSGIAYNATKVEGSATNGNIKINGIETTVYSHPSSHSADMITTNSSRRFVSDSQISTWNNKQNALGYTPENVANKNKANGYVGLDSNGKIPLIYIPDTAKQQTYVVLNSTERNALTNLISGDKCFETSTGDTYIYDGTSWILQSDADWANVNLDWANINGKPSSNVSAIDDAVNKRHSHSKTDTEITDAVNNRHNHSNKTVLDKITQTGTETSFDLSDFVTQDQLGNAGYGDMTKSIYDSNNDGVVNRADVADSVDWANVLNKPSSFTPSSHIHDDRYYTETEVDSLLSNKSDTSHTHSQLHTHSNKSTLDKISYSGSNTTIDLKQIETNTSAISSKANVNHTHIKSEIVDFAHIHTKSDISDFSHTHDDRYYTESEINSLLSGKASSTHTHDDRYYTETEVNNLLSGKANSSHNHDGVYSSVSHNHDSSYINKSGDSVTYLDFGNFRVQGNTTDKSLDILFLG